MAKEVVQTAEAVHNLDRRIKALREEAAAIPDDPRALELITKADALQKQKDAQLRKICS